MIAPRHAEIADHELREEREVEADEDDAGAQLREPFVVQAPADLRPPVVQPAEISHDRAADHDVVEVRDDEVRVGHVHVDADRRQEQSGEPSDREQPDEAVRVEHRRLPRHRALVHRRRPVEDFHRRRNCHEKAEDRKDQRRVDRFAGHEHVMAPHEESKNRDGEACERDERVAEDRLAAAGGDELADDAHRRQHHDVDRRVRVEPEQVLEQQRVAAQLRVEDADVEEPLGPQEQDGDRDDRRPQDDDQAGGVHRPDEEGQPEPGQARRPHAVDGDDEVEQDRREAGDEDAERRRNDVGRRCDGAERRVEGPAGIEPAADERIQREEAADDVDVPAQKVDLRKREILGADHDRHQEVAEHRRNDGDEEEEHHHHAMHREQLVVGFVGHQVAGRRGELEPDEHRHRAADDEEEGDAGEVQQGDALVIAREQPRPDAVAVVQVVTRWKKDG